jgi:transposase
VSFGADEIALRGIGSINFCEKSTSERGDAVYMIEAKPENLIGDRAYDSDPLDAQLRKDGIEMIAPHRSNRSKPPTQDRRRLSRYMRRWLVERFFAWIQWQRRILIRWEYHAHNFLGFVQLACLVILFKRF